MFEPVLELVDIGLGASLQDLGRQGWKRFGVPPGGALDRHAARWANLLLGNLPHAPVLEILLVGTRLRALRRIELAVTGAAATAPDGPGWRTFVLEADAPLTLPPPPAGVWSYLAIPGGFEGTRWFGSVSIFPRGGLGERLAAGALLGRSCEPSNPTPTGVGQRWLAPAVQRNYLQPPPIPVWPGPQWDLFRDSDRLGFFERPWTVSASSDRTGYRLEGTPLSGATEAIPSEPLLPGSIQVPPGGLPIVTMRDGPTVGGYPKLGLVDPAHLSWLAQCRPGQQIRSFLRPPDDGRLAPSSSLFGNSMPSLFLMVLGTDLDPERVTDALGMRPSDSWRRGDKKRAALPDGKTLRFKSVHKWGGWKLHYQPARTGPALVRKMMGVATRLRKRKSRLRALTTSGHDVFLISLVQDAASIVLPPRLHTLLGELGVHLQIDFWPSQPK